MKFKELKIYFVTITINGWAPIFEDYPEMKKCIYESFSFLVENNAVDIHGFVIMKDHIHVLMKAKGNNQISRIVNRFKSYTAHRIFKFLDNTDYITSYFSSRRADRINKIWKQRFGCLRIQHRKIYRQKLIYIHKNPIKEPFKCVNNPEDYFDSSARSYKIKKAEFKFLTLRFP